MLPGDVYACQCKPGTFGPACASKQEQVVNAQVAAWTAQYANHKGRYFVANHNISLTLSLKDLDSGYRFKEVAFASVSVRINDREPQVWLPRDLHSLAPNASAVNFNLTRGSDFAVMTLSLKSGVFDVEFGRPTVVLMEMEAYVSQLPVVTIVSNVNTTASTSLIKLPVQNFTIFASMLEADKVAATPRPLPQRDDGQVGVIVGIVIGCLLGLTFLGITTYCCMRRAALKRRVFPR